MCYIYKIEKGINKMSKDTNLMKNVLVENVDDSITQGQKIKKQVVKKGSVINNDTIVNNILRVPKQFDFSHVFRFTIWKHDPERYLYYIKWIINEILMNCDNVRWYQQNGVAFDDRWEVQLIVLTNDKDELKKLIGLVEDALNNKWDLIGDIYDEFVLKNDY
jgi:hypothetical protein